MKKLTVLLVAILLTISSLQIKAQSSQAYAKGDKVVQLGLSLGSFGSRYLGYSGGFSVPLNASAEFGIHDYISVGPFVGYNRWKYRYYDGNYGWNFLAVGARGSFHYLPFLNELLETSVDEDKFDFYATFLLGLNFISYRDGENSYYYGRYTRLTLGPALGFRYKFNENFGAYAEAGRGSLGFLTLGASLHF